MMVHQKTMFQQLADSKILLFPMLLALAALACNLPFAGSADSTALKPGEYFQSSDGVLVGDPAEALEQQVELEVELVGQAPSLPTPVDSVGGIYQISASQSAGSGPEKTFVIGLPLPEDEQSEQLALALWVRPDEILDGGPDPQGYWSYFDAFFDQDQRMLFASMPSLSQQGRLIRLVRADHFETGSVTPTSSTNTQSVHPMSVALPVLLNLPSLDPGASTSKQVSAGISFEAYCSPNFPTDTFETCGPTKIAAAEADMQAAWDLYQEELNLFGPSLERRVLRMEQSGDQTYPVLGAYLMELKSCSQVDDSDKKGEYSPADEKAWVCYGFNGYTDDTSAAIRHEYFHAIQYSYFGLNQTAYEDWIVEGQATAAMFSDETGYDRWQSYNPLPVDHSLNGGVVQYAAQDLWIYYGQYLGRDLRYLHDIMIGGSTSSGVESAIQGSVGGFFGLGDLYWSFAKNQAFEKAFDLGGNALGSVCELEVNFLNSGYIPLGSEDEDPVTDLTTIQYQVAATPNDHTFTLDPLSSVIIELDFQALDLSPYSASVEVITSSSEIVSHYYDQDYPNPTDCQGTADSTSLSLSVPAGEDQTRYLLAANTSLTARNQFLLRFPQQQEGFHIIQPAAAETFTEADDIPFAALATGIGDPDITFSIDWIVDRYRVDAGGVVTTTFANSNNGETILYDGFCDGQYTVTAKALLPSGGPFTDTVTFTVTDLGETTPPEKCAPSIQIESPTDRTNYSEGDTIAFSASIEDDHFETDEPIFDVSWFADGANSGVEFLGSGLSFSKVLEPGFYTVEARYGAARDFVDIFVVDLEEGEEANVPPDVNIISPSNNSQFQETGNVPVTFVGEASDDEDGVLTGSSLQWSYRQGSSGAWQAAGQGTSTTITFPGSCNWVSYQVQLTAEDSAGRTTSDSIVISARGPTC